MHFIFSKLGYNFKRSYGDMPLIPTLKQRLDNYAMDRKKNTAVYSNEQGSNLCMGPNSGT